MSGESIEAMYKEHLSEVARAKADAQRAIRELETEDPDEILASSLFKSEKDLGSLRGIDFDKDDDFDHNDIDALKDFLKGIRELSDLEKEMADVNNDGNVDNDDLMRLVMLFEERRKAEKKVIDLQGLYESLLAGQNHAHVVLGIDNTSVDQVKNELYKARSILRALS